MQPGPYDQIIEWLGRIFKLDRSDVSRRSNSVLRSVWEEKHVWIQLIHVTGIINMKTKGSSTSDCYKK
jgi:hypothetical protein